jgi:hypothetical protein
MSADTGTSHCRFWHLETPCAETPDDPISGAITLTGHDQHSHQLLLRVIVVWNSLHA